MTKWPSELCDAFSAGKGLLLRILLYIALSAIQIATRWKSATIFIHPCRSCRFTIQFAVEGVLGGIRFVPPRESPREFALVIGPGRIGNDSRSSFSSRAAPPPNRFLDKVDGNGLEEYSRRRRQGIEYCLISFREMLIVTKIRKALQMIEHIMQFEENVSAELIKNKKSARRRRFC